MDRKDANKKFGKQLQKAAVLKPAKPYVAPEPDWAKDPSLLPKHPPKKRKVDDV